MLKLIATIICLSCSLVPSIAQDDVVKIDKLPVGVEKSYTLTNKVEYIIEIVNLTCVSIVWLYFYAEVEGTLGYIWDF